MTATEKKLRIAVAMSGGVDSSVTAALLKRAGHEVFGITLKLYDPKRTLGPDAPSPVEAAVADAAAAAARLGIDHHVLDYTERFHRDIIGGFVADYAAGRTPIPCAHCNARIKFGQMLDDAQALGADALASGHYATLIDGANGTELHRASDKKRDQSYFLFEIPRDRLAALRFPLGGFHKPDVRNIAAELGLKVAAKPDSQDICFVAGGRYDGLVQRLDPAALTPGNFVDLAGNVIGQHHGIAAYTVGQHKRLGVAGFAEAQFVIRLVPERNEVVIGPRAALSASEVPLTAVNWLADPAEAARCTVKIRSMRAPVPASVTPTEGGARVLLDTPEEAVAPGQACVFYDGERVLGGGWIVRPTAPSPSVGAV